jgi:hypothetical protein
MTIVEIPASAMIEVLQYALARAKAPVEEQHGALISAPAARASKVPCGTSMITEIDVRAAYCATSRKRGLIRYRNNNRGSTMP